MSAAVLLRRFAKALIQAEIAKLQARVIISRLLKSFKVTPTARDRRRC